jgi:hypothetical protein
MGEVRDEENKDIAAENVALRARVLELEKHVVDREKQVADLEKQVRELIAKLGGRKASHSRKQRYGPHRKPGRKAGQGPFERRGEPKAGTVTRVKVPVAHPRCPKCGGAWRHRTETASTTDAPVLCPEVTVFEVEVCECEDCGAVVRGEHPDLPPDQRGATAHRVGIRAKAAAHALHYGIGIPRQQVPVVLRELTGVSITQSALTQDALKRAEQLQPAVEQLRKDVVSDTSVNTDDTGWRIGGTPAFMMNFNNHDTSAVQIRYQHRSNEVLEVIPADYAGVMGTDRTVAYDAKVFDNVKQQKCNGHIIRNVNEAMERQDATNRWFGRDLLDTLRRAMRLRRDHLAGDVDELDFALAGCDLDEGLSHLLRPRTLADPDNQRLLDGLGWHQRRGNLLRYLEDPRIEPTNNSSERDLRGSVKARKVSHCNKNQRGADATAAHLSLILTIRRRLRGCSLVHALIDLFRTGLAPPRLVGS